MEGMIWRVMRSSSLGHCLFPSLLSPLLSRPPLLLRQFATKQVKGHKKVNPKKQEVEIRQRMTVAELAHAMNKDPEHVFEALLNTPAELQGEEEQQQEVLEERWIKEVLKRSGMKYRWERLTTEKERENKDARRRVLDPACLRPRPPVVTIMGHVDHGKTSLLDALRQSQLVEQEAGGITQHIGAFLVALPTGEQITFLDTPGHAAFTSMRARGANATDIIILVVAADDGVMEQTVESIQHAKNAQVPVIVAVNKCDKPQAEPDRVTRELLQHGLVGEELGGDVQVIPVSALKGDNLLLLAEATVALAEVLELKAEPSGLVEGVILESRMDRGRGAIATVLVQQGSLKKGCVLVAGRSWAKVRLLFDELDQVMEGAGPSRAVQVVGWKDLPSVGEELLEVESEQRAREVVEWRSYQEEQAQLKEEQKVIHERQQEHRDRYQEERRGHAHLSWRQRKAALYRAHRQEAALRPSEKDLINQHCLPLVLKGDVDGSVEALLTLLDSYDSHDQCQMDLVHFGVGDVSEKDVVLAETFSGSIYGFNVAANKSILRLAEKKGVQIHLHNVIYQLMDGLKDELSSKLPVLLTHKVLGEAAVLMVLEVTVGKKKVPVAGCRVRSGLLDRNKKFRLLRDQNTLWEGSLTALKHHKEDVQTVKTGVECGLSIDTTLDFSPGDVIICYEEISQPQLISWDPGF